MAPCLLGPPFDGTTSRRLLVRTQRACRVAGVACPVPISSAGPLLFLRVHVYRPGYCFPYVISMSTKSAKLELHDVHTGAPVHSIAVKGTVVDIEDCGGTSTAALPGSNWVRSSPSTPTTPPQLPPVPTLQWT